MEGGIKVEENKQEERIPRGVEAMCWSCSKIWNITLLSKEAKAVKCTCGGFVVTETGKAMTRPFYNEFDSMAPLLEETTYTDTIAEKLTGSNAKAKGRIIIPGVND